MSKIIEIQVKPNQTIWDIALERHGSIEGLFDLLEHNDFDDVNVELTDTQILLTDKDLVVDETTLAYYKNNNINPASEVLIGDYNTDFNGDFYL